MTEGNRSRIRKDDKVIVLSGNSRGKTGDVFKISGDKVFIRGVNVRKKHVKPTRTSKGGIMEMEMPVHASNVKVCVDGKPVKLHVKESNDGKKVLYYKSGSSEIEYRTLSRK